ncbi:MAG: hypothetical protein WCD53_00665 [Microcoleus sp.]
MNFYLFTQYFSLALQLAIARPLGRRAALSFCSQSENPLQNE